MCVPKTLGKELLLIVQAPLHATLNMPGTPASKGIGNWVNKENAARISTKRWSAFSTVWRLFSS
jgi:hypothetical protein